MSSETPDEPRHAPLVSLFVRDARLCLAYERSRAPSFRHALNQWLKGQFKRWQRLRRLGPGKTRELLQTELACAHVGFGVEVTADNKKPEGVCAPWHLPEVALRTGVQEWLRHPLIDTTLPQWHSNSASGAKMLLEHLGAGPNGPGWKVVSLWSGGAQTKSPARLAVVLHLYYPELWAEIFESLRSLPEPWDLYITAPVFASTPWIARIADAVPNVSFFPGANRGRDVLPWLRLIDAGALKHYEWVCKLHTKRSPHLTHGGLWRQQLLAGVIGSTSETERLIASLRQRPKAGVACAADAIVAGDDPRWAGSSLRAVRRIRKLLSLNDELSRDPYPAGTMFWFRPQALSQLGELARCPSAFEVEMGQTDGTAAHAIERLVVTVASRSGFGLHIL